MARIRSIKPEFPQSETIGRLSRDARLLFIQLWTIADDEGRARAASRMLASLLYPYDDDASKLIDGWLDELERAGCIRRYEVEGSSYLDIPNWLKHQKIDRPSKSRLPEFDEHSTRPREASRGLAPDLGPRTMDQDLGKDQSSLRSDSVGRSATRPCVRQQDFEEFWSVYPKRTGSNPKKPAELKFRAAVRGGTPAAVIVEGARRYAFACREQNILGTTFVAQAVTWLNQARWSDYADSASPSPQHTGPPAHLQGAERAAWIRQRMAEQERAENGLGKAVGGLLGEGQTVRQERHDRPAESTLV